MTDKIRAIAERVLQLDGLANKGPWTCEPPYTIVTYPFSYAAFQPGSKYYRDEDGKLVAHYRTVAPTLARALILAIEALQDIDGINLEEAGYYLPRSFVRRRARGALAAIAKLGEGEGNASV